MEYNVGDTVRLFPNSAVYLIVEKNTTYTAINILSRYKHDDIRLDFWEQNNYEKISIEQIKNEYGELPNEELVYSILGPPIEWEEVPDAV